LTVADVIKAQQNAAAVWGVPGSSVLPLRMGARGLKQGCEPASEACPRLLTGSSPAYNLNQD
jgi:hypothetical protein